MLKKNRPPGMVDDYGTITFWFGSGFIWFNLNLLTSYSNLVLYKIMMKNRSMYLVHGRILVPCNFMVKAMRLLLVNQSDQKRICFCANRFKGNKFIQIYFFKKTLIFLLQYQQNYGLHNFGFLFFRKNDFDLLLGLVSIIIFCPL